MTAHAHAPIILVDTDALIDMTPWDHLAKARDWEGFFSHLPEAGVHNAALIDRLTDAARDGCWITYTSRWWTEHRDEVRAWLAAHETPRGALYLRPSPRIDPARLAYNHTRFIAQRGGGVRPVFVIHADTAVAAALRKRGIAALGVDQVPMDAERFRAMLTHARKVPNTKPKEEG